MSTEPTAFYIQVSLVIRGGVTFLENSNPQIPTKTSDFGHKTGNFGIKTEDVKEKDVKNMLVSVRRYSKQRMLRP